MSDSSRYEKLLSVAISAVVSGMIIYYGNIALRNILRATAGQQLGQVLAKEERAKLAKKLRRPELEYMEFDTYEQRILTDGLVDVDETNVTFKDIGGLEKELEEVKDNVVLPMRLWKFFKDSDVNAGATTCPLGVLLYGKPGTGKTLTAKAIATESGATFISVKASSLLDKYVGESDKLVAALFKIARKLAPTVIFIDEIETMLKRRADSTLSCVTSMQGVFLAEWDGLSQGLNAGPVVVLGATNRPLDLDQAFLRRLPVRVNIKMPDEIGRRKIFETLLSKEKVDDNVDLNLLATHTPDCSGSDIREVVRIANMRRKKEFLKIAEKHMEEEKARLAEIGSKLGTNPTLADDASAALTSSIALRPLSMEDFLYALTRKEAAAAIFEFPLDLPF